MSSDYHAPEIPEDARLLELHRAASELLGIVSRRMLDADLETSAVIVLHLQAAAMAPAVSVTVTMPDGSTASINPTTTKDDSHE